MTGIQGYESLILHFLITLGMRCVILLHVQAKWSTDFCELCKLDLLPGVLS